ncbi:MAG: diacylglycerol kinase [Rhizobiales bacterium]|nr:diacylglycerol kinase [Hyphomicrobiales bacterium]
MSQEPHKLDKKTGVAHFFAAAQYSWAGLRYMTGEVPFRHELSATITLLAILFWQSADPFHILLTFALCLITIAFEAVNSAIELIVDRVSPEYSKFAKNAKDVGSFAVCTLMIATGACFAFALYATV